MASHDLRHQPAATHAASRWLAGAATGIALAWLTACSGSPTAPSPPPPGAPTLTCPADVTLQSPDGRPVSVAFATPVPQRGVSPVTVACDAPDLFPVGSTKVTCTATDAIGQKGTCSFSAKIEGPPTLVLAHFMAFGDSLTSGVVSPAPSLFLLKRAVALPDGYPAKLEVMLRSRYERQTVIVDNDGVPGESATEDGVGRFRPDVMTYRPDVVLLMEGTNDLLSRSPDRIIPALEAMVIEGKSQGKLVFLATIPPQRAGGLRHRDYVAGIIPTFNAMIKDLAQRQQVPLVDVYTPLAADLSLIGQDDLHPTVLGYEVMARTFYDVIVAQLEFRGMMSRRP